MRSADEICKDVVRLHGGILAAAILEKGSLRGMHTRIEWAALRLQNRPETIASPAESLMGSLGSEADYGRVHYLMSHGDKADAYMFPVWLNGRRMLLAVQVTPPYSHDELSALLRRYIGETMSPTRH